MRRLAALLVLSLSLSLPAWAQAGAHLKSIVLSPVQAGVNDSVMGTVTLSGPAPGGGAYVQLSAADTIWVPGTVVVPEGMTTSVFVVSVTSRPSNGSGVVVGSWQGESVSSNTLLCLADPARAAQAQQQAAQAAQAAQDASSYSDPYGWGYGYYGYPAATPVIRPNTYTPVGPSAPITSFSGMGGMPAAPMVPSGPAVGGGARMGGFRR